MSRQVIVAAIASVLAVPAARAQPKTTCVEPGEQGLKVRIETDGNTPARTTVCFGTDCYAYAAGAKPAKLAKSGGPRMYKPVVEVRDNAGALSACTGQKCDKLGP